MSNCISPPTKLAIFCSLIRPKLTYSSQVWRPHLSRDIKSLEKVQRQATKYILHDFSSSYKDRLTTLKLLPLSLWLEYLDISFLLNCLQNPQDHFNIFHYVRFCSNNTRSSSSSKLRQATPFTHLPNNHINFHYFNRIVPLWNSLPAIDLSRHSATIKRRLKQHLWQYFLESYDSESTCTWYYCCSCSHCILSHSTNYSPLLSS